MATQVADSPPQARVRGPALALKKCLRKPKLLRPAAASLKSKAPAASPAVKTKPLSDILAGALARAGSQSTIHPLDTIKVKMQAGVQAAAAAKGQAVSMHARVHKGLSKFAKLVPPVGGRVSASGAVTAQQHASYLGRKGSSALNKVGGLYRGVGGAATGAGIAIGAYFAVYGAASNAIVRLTKGREISPGMVAFLAGAIAAGGSSVVKVPLAVCIRSVQAGVYPNVFAAQRQIVRAAGVRGLFTGFWPTLLEDVPDMAFKFAMYEGLRELHTKFTNRPTTAQEDLLIGGASGCFAAGATTPLDVIKTRMMCAASSRPSVASAAASVMKEGKGISGFFVGIGPRAVSNGINTAVFFMFFEALRVYFKNRESNRALAAEARKAAQAARVARLEKQQEEQQNFLLVEYHEGVPQPLGASLSTSHAKVGRKRL